MFFIFTRACKKYRYSYIMNTNSGIRLTLYPNNSLGYIEIAQEYYERNYFKLFLTAIKKMRAYRKEHT